MRRTGLLAAILLVTIAAIGATIAQAQSTQPPSPTYIGSAKCAACHPAIYQSWSATLHAKMVQDPTRNPTATVILADFAKMSSIITDTRLQYTSTNVVLTLGWRYQQRYILADPKTGRLVMGAGQWNIAGQGPSAADNTWQNAAPGEDWLKECAGCHTTGFNLEKSSKFTAADYKAGKDMPFVELGIGCEACHGPASEHIKSPNKNNIPVNAIGALDAQTCGQCHARGISKDDRGETHGYPLGYTPGGELSKANWTPLTPTGIITDANWWADGHAKKNYQQYLEWLTSRHAAALDTLKKTGGQDSCVPCHSADAYLASKKRTVLKLSEARFGVTCSACHNPHKENAKTSDSLLRDEPYAECTACHNATSGGIKLLQAGQAVHAPIQEMYEGTGAIGVEDRPSTHWAIKENRPVCSSCHMPGISTSADIGDIATHNWKIVMPGRAEKDEPSSCSACHNPNTPITQDALPLQQVIDKRQKEISDKIAALEARLKTIIGKNPTWFEPRLQAPTENAPDKFRAAFTNLSFVKADGSKGLHNYEYAQSILAQADRDLKLIEQPSAPTPTFTPLPPTPVLPTPIPSPTLSPTPMPPPQPAPEAGWLMWLSLAVVVAIVVLVLFIRKPRPL